jgi:hypothetical protein
MKATLFLLVALLAPVSYGVQQALPEAFPDSKYEKLKSDWPFTLAKPPEEKKEEVIPWAQNLYLSSVVVQRTAEGGEQPWVAIKDKQEPSSFTQLTLNEEKDGMQLVKVENLDDPKKTTATVKKNNEFATLKRDEAAWTSTAPVQPPGAPRPGGVVRPGGQPPGLPLQNPQNAIKVPGANVPKPLAIPKPNNGIPLPAAPVQPGAAAQPAQTGQPGQPDARKRVRVINNGR